MNQEEKYQFIEEIPSTEFAITAFEQFPAKVALLTPDLRISWMNNELKEVIGPESKGKKCFKVYQNNLEKCKECPLSGPPAEGETQRIICEGALKGRIIHFTHRAISIDEKSYILEVWKDITDRREAEKRASHLATFPEKNPTPILEWDSEFNLTYTNSAAEEYASLGTPEHPLRPKNLEDIVRSMKASNERRQVQELKYEGKVFSEYIYFFPDESVTRLYAHDITTRKKIESKYYQSKRNLILLTRSNQILIRAGDEEKLLNDICHAIVQIGGYCLAWVGYAKHDEKKSVKVVAQSGFSQGYLESVDITWSMNDTTGLGPTGKAIQTGSPQIAHIMTDGDYQPWREEAVDRGYASSIALPLIQEDTTYGALNIYSTDPDAFEQKEVEILSELAQDLAFGISTRRERKRKRSLEAELKNLSNHLLDRREKERNRISRELHDELGQLTTAILISLSDYRNRAQNSSDLGDPAKLEKIEDMVETLDTKVRDLAVEIHPPSIDELGLISTLKSDAEEINNTHDAQVILEADQVESSLAMDKQIHMYRVIHEAVNNALEHGEPEEVLINIKKEEDHVRLVIADDGKGFDFEEIVATGDSSRRLGIIGMRERIHSLAGSIDIESTPGEGTRVSAEIPYDK